MNAFPNQIKAPIVAEYLLLIHPNKDLCERITAIKQHFHDKYKAPTALSGKQHITLVKYAQYAGFESRIVQRLRQVALEWRPIFIELENFGSFPSHTIFINVKSKATIADLVKKIRTIAQGLMKLDKDNKPHFIMEAHITIAHRLKPWQYEQGWLEYSHQNFSGKFIATEMVLLKKELGAQKYSFVENFVFQNMPVIATQALLF